MHLCAHSGALLLAATWKLREWLHAHLHPNAHTNLVSLPPNGFRGMVWSVRELACAALPLALLFALELNMKVIGRMCELILGFVKRLGSLCVARNSVCNAVWVMVRVRVSEMVQVRVLGSE